MFKKSDYLFLPVLIDYVSYLIIEFKKAINRLFIDLYQNVVSSKLTKFSTRNYIQITLQQ